MDESWGAAWADALDELELSVEQAERLLRHDEDPPTEQVPVWHPPTIGGPPPPEQLERARRLLERHLQATHDLAEAITATRQQLTLTSRMSRNRPQGMPVYIDVSA